MIHQKIGAVASEWAWIESLLSEMVSHFCAADPGAMYVVTQNVGTATIINWLRTLIEIKIKDALSAKIIGDLLLEIDDVRKTRNTLVHGTWWAGDTPEHGYVQTFRWDRTEVVKSELWSAQDIQEVVEEIKTLQLKLSNLGIKMGFLTLQSKTA
jgi:hypothetical protein